MSTSKLLKNASPLTKSIFSLLIVIAFSTILMIVIYLLSEDIKRILASSTITNTNNPKDLIIIPLLFLSLAALIALIISYKNYRSKLPYEHINLTKKYMKFNLQQVEDIYNFRDVLYKKIKQEVIIANIQEIKEEIKQQSKKDPLINVFNTATSKIEGHSRFLSGVLHISLFIGIAFAATSLSIVFFYTPNIPVQVSASTLFIATITIKLLFAGSVQMLALFFLNLYKKTLLELKYLQNEVTNIELKKSSVLLSSEFSEENKLKISMALINTERNTLLQNGESTEHIEQTKSQSTEMIELLKTLQAIARK